MPAVAGLRGVNERRQYLLRSPIIFGAIDDLHTFAISLAEWQARTSHTLATQCASLLFLPSTAQQHNTQDARTYLHSVKQLLSLLTTKRTFESVFMGHNTRHAAVIIRRHIRQTDTMYKSRQDTRQTAQGKRKDEASDLLRLPLLLPLVGF